MPAPLSEEELEEIIDDVIAEVGATNLRAARSRDGGRDAAGRGPRRRLDGQPVGSRKACLRRTRPRRGCAAPTTNVDRSRQPPEARDGTRAKRACQVFSCEVRRTSHDDLHWTECRKFSTFRTRSPPSSQASSDGVLDSLRDRLDCTIRLRGNQLTIEGDEPQRRRGTRGRRGARRARRGRTRDRAVDRRRRTRRARRGRTTSGPSSTTSSGATAARRSRRRRSRRSTTSTRSAAARSRSASGRRAPARRTSRSRSRSRRFRSARSTGSSSRARRSRPASGSGSCPATCSRRSTRTCARSSTRCTTCSRPTASRRTSTRARRGRAARVHARPHAQRLVRHPRRGAEHEPGADADVPDAARLRLEGRRHRRRDAGRPSARAGVRADPGAGHPRGRSTAIAFVRFTHQDVVRHKLVQRIVEAYKQHAEETGTTRSR